MTFSNDEEVDACQDARPHTIDGKAVSWLISVYTEIISNLLAFSASSDRWRPKERLPERNLESPKPVKQ